jgi:outer membrane lipoprotein-sorting protein
MVIMRVQFVVCLVLVVAGSSARAWQGGQPFSADSTSTSTRTGTKSTGKIYFSPPKMRIDTSSRGGEVIMITDASTKTSYMLMPPQHTYMEFHADQNKPTAKPITDAAASYDPKHPCAADATCKKTGTETVNGRICENWEFTTKRGTTKVCVDQKLLYPLRTVSVTGDVTELSNVKEGKPDASVFEIPAGYRKMDMGSMMGGRPPR